LKVKFILPALTEAKSPYWRPIKYSLFPPLGLAALAAYLSDEDEIDLQDEHVEKLRLDDRPDLVAIEVYITNAYRAYKIADHYRSRGAFVILGGLHVTALPEEAQKHADAIFLGPAEESFPRFLTDYKRKRTQRRYESRTRTLRAMPEIRRDLIKRDRYLVPNSIIVSRGCPHHCDFCYKDSFFKGGKTFYVKQIEDVLKDDDDQDVFKRTVDWAIDNGITTCTFHILTPYPGTRLYRNMAAAGRIVSRNWDLYDTRHVVFKTKQMSARQLTDGYGLAYELFYSWSAIFKAGLHHDRLKHRLKHLAYAGGWKKFEPLWNFMIKAGALGAARPLLEAVLSAVKSSDRDKNTDTAMQAAIKSYSPLQQKR